MTKMTDDQLVALVQAHRRDSLGYEDGELSQDRAKAMDAYHGRPYGNEVVGRSQVVSRDLMETVDWAMPAIMRAFTQSGSVGEFDPVGPEDEAQARQESDYTNQVIMKDNDGWMVIHDAVKDTLILRNGYSKERWAEETKISEEKYSGLTLDQLTQMSAQLKGEGAEVDVVEQSSEKHVIPEMGEVELFDVTLKIRRKCGRVRVEAVPPEEIRVSKRCNGSLRNSPFVEHNPRGITRSDLIEMGMPRSFVDDLPAYKTNENSIERQARNTTSDEKNDEDSIADKSMDEMDYSEAYIRVDYDGDGVAELRKVVTVANKLPPGKEWNEPIEVCPITAWVGKRVPHRHIGESLWDELADLQEIQTALKRQLNDNVYLTNSTEKAVNERVNLRDLLTTTPGGVKRVKGDGPVGDSIMPLVTPSIIDKILPAIDYYDKVKEIRSGIRPGSDMDPDILRETTKGAFLESLNRASQKIEMITRMLAETGLKDLFLQVHDLLIRHQDKPRVVQMRGQWVSVNPREWESRTDLTVKVGLGTGNQEEQRAKIGQLAQMQGQLLQAAASAPPPVYERMYTLFSDMCKTMGIEVPEKYAIAPNSPEYQQLAQQAKSQPNPEVAKEQVKAQAKMQSDQAAKQSEIQLERERMTMQAQVDQHRQEVEAQQQALKIQNEKDLAILREHLADQRHQREAEYGYRTAVDVAKVNAAAKIDAAQLSANSVLNAAQETASDQAVQQ